MQSACAQLINVPASLHDRSSALICRRDFLSDHDAANCAHTSGVPVQAARRRAQDNVGLLVGDGAQRIQRALVTIDLTASVLAEASELSSDLVR